ncbi:MAG: hypothetical protein OTI36_19125 [Beijerinckiaceae bacterium]|nr:hypothetical protein [Beijerinckiaceae bacterium]
MDEIASLDPNGGPSFLVLSSTDSCDYMQAAGGRGAYIAECRQYDGQAFRHYAAGHPGPAAADRVKIKTSSFHVTVPSNEKLTCDEVQYLAYAFIKGSCRSSFFAWRDMTDRFV